MDVHWMQNFLCLPAHCIDARSSVPNRPLSLDDLDGDDDSRTDFTCPFCYEDFDIASLCSHLEDEHCYESKSAVCPICVAKLGKDMVGHITLQHGHLFKKKMKDIGEFFDREKKHMQRRRRFRKAGTPSSSTFSLLGNELREAHLQALLGGNPSHSTASTSNAAADPLLSTLVYSVPTPAMEDVSKYGATSEEALAKSSASSDQHIPSSEAYLSAEEREQKLEEEAMRAKFVQQLVLSMIFSDR